MDAFEQAVALLRDGRTTYDEFARQTVDRWELTARWLMRRWRLPGWVEVSDVTQDLLVGAWKATWRYDARRGSMPLGRYVRVSAVNDALKVIHKLRGANLHTYRGEQIERPFSTLGEDAEGMVDALLSTPAEQEELLEDERSRRLAMDACASLEELLVVQALHMARSFLGGAAIMWGDAETREMLELRSEEHAARVVVRAAHSVVVRLAQQQAA